MDTTSVELGLAGQSGEGMLHLPNLGTKCDYPFRVSGFGGGLQAGISRVAASGAVTGMKKISDLTGDYRATRRRGHRGRGRRRDTDEERRQ